MKQQQLCIIIMHTGYISFCDNLGLNIKSNDVKEVIAKELETKYKVKIIRKHYEKLDERQLAKLQKSPHMVCLRSNGNPYYLYLSKYQHTNQCYFVDKKVQGGYNLPRIIVSKLRFHDSLFEKGTLFEGEMVKDIYGNWVYLIHDLIGYGGYLENENIVKRINLAYDILNTMFVPDETDVCYIQVKRYVTYDKIHELVYDAMPTLPYTCRGMYFKPLYMRFLDVLMNFDDTLIKKVERVKYQSMSNGFLANKEELLAMKAEQNSDKGSDSGSVKGSSSTVVKSTVANATVCNSDVSIFTIEKTHSVDVYNLYDNNKKAVGIAGIITTNTSRMLQELFKNVNIQTKFQVKCKYHPKFQKWVPINAV